MIDQVKLDEWKTAFEDFVIGDIRKAIKQDNLEVGLILLTFIAIDTLGGYLAGKDATSKSFKRFLKRYFPASYAGYVNEIWKLRNDLMHDYALRTQFVMNREPLEPHLTTCRQKGEEYVWFNRSLFARDLLEAWDKFLADVTNDPFINRRLEKRIDNRGFLKVRAIECE